MPFHHPNHNLKKGEPFQFFFFRALKIRKNPRQSDLGPGGERLGRHKRGCARKSRHTANAVLKQAGLKKYF
jgi:hypothetical protein